MDVFYSCVVDRSPKFFRQAYNLVLSLRAVGVPAANIYVNLTPPAEVYRDEFERLGCTTLSTPLFGDNKYCNKVAQLRNAPTDADFVVCCDTDLLFLRNIEPDLEPKKGKVLGKIVDFGNPPIERLRAVVALTPDLPDIADETTDVDGVATLAGNFNGGLYILPGKHVRAFSKMWEHYALHLLHTPDAQAALGDFSWHIDQISFCFALHKLALDFDMLPITFNFPLHFPVLGERSENYEEVRILHYHTAVDENYFPNPVNVENPKFRTRILEAAEAMRTLTYVDDAEDIASKRAATSFTFVMGFHRSGTSILASGCNSIGYSVGSGELLAAADDNPKGYYENRALVKINEEIQRGLDSEWDDIFFSFKGDAEAVADKYVMPISSFLQNEFLIDDHPRYVLKDPRVMQTYGVWRRAIQVMGYPTPEIIFVYRNPLECAQSQQMRYKKNFLGDGDPFHFFGRDLRETLILWYVYNVRFLLTMKTERAIVVQYSDLIASPKDSLTRLSDWAGLETDNEAIDTFAEQFFDKNLRHHERSAEDLRKATLDISFVYDLYQQLERLSTKQQVTPGDLRNIAEKHAEPFGELMDNSFLGRLISVPRLKWIYMRARQGK